MNLEPLNKIGKTILICLIPIMIFIGIKSNRKKERELAEDSSFTVGYASKWQSENRSGSYMYYSFWVRSKRYESREPCGIERRKLVRKRYFVQYYTPNPHNSKLLLDHPVPDWLTEAPPSGWAEMPELDMKNKKIIEKQIKK